GQWDSFLDPLRDFEDDYVVGTQKSIEDATGIHIGAGIQEAWSWSFNTPPNQTRLIYDNFLTQNSWIPEIGQVRATRPGQGWSSPASGSRSPWAIPPHASSPTGTGTARSMSATLSRRTASMCRRPT